MIRFACLVLWLVVFFLMCSLLAIWVRWFTLALFVVMVLGIAWWVFGWFGDLLIVGVIVWCWVWAFWTCGFKVLGCVTFGGVGTFGLGFCFAALLCVYG